MSTQTTSPAADAIVVFDREGRIESVNDAAGKLWGVDSERMIGRDIDSFAPLHPRNWAATPAPITLPVRIRRADGTVEWHHASVSILHGQHTPLHVVTVHHAANTAQSPAPIGIDQLDAPVVIADADGAAVHINGSARRLFGDIGDPGLTQTLERLLPALHSQAAASAENDRDDAVLRRLEAGETVGAQGLVTTLDGQPRWFASTTNPVCDAHGLLLYTMSTLTEITDTKVRETVQQAVLEAMAHDRPLPEIMTTMCIEIERMAPGVAVSILRVDEQGRLQALAGPSLPEAFMHRIDGVAIGPTVGSCGTAAFRGESVVVTDIATDPLWAPYREYARKSGMAACWSTPFRGSDGRVIGTFAFYYRTRRAPDAFHYRLTEICTHLCALALERDAAREKIRRQAFHDTLTDLPNRQSLRARIEEAIASSQRTGAPLALMFIDLDGFKQINDTLGHEPGDLLLRESASRLERLAPQGATVGRRSGDEFAIVLPGYDSTRALALAETLRAALAETSDAIPGRHLSISASIGVSVLPEHGNDRETLLRRTDLAVRSAKRAGRNRVCLFEPDQEARAAERARFEQALKEALVRRELALHYQPKVDLRDGRVSGVEALARWHHPELGNVSPAQFIPLAEECGLIVELGCWALNEACGQLARWRNVGLAVPSVAVNLSPLHFRHRELPVIVAAILEEHGLVGGDLTLEITEGVFMEKRPETRATIAAIRELGVHLSMDDFGTGYSSLAHLLDLPVDELKLDQKFVSGLGCHEAATTLVEAAIRIGRNLGLAVVAEGIEDERQRAFLTELGCETGQGYLFAKPMPPQSLSAWLTLHGAAGR